MSDNTIKFKEHLVVTGRQDVTIERVFQALGEYSGIHAFKFDATLEDDFSTLDSIKWGSYSSGAWVATGELQGTGAGGDNWYFMLSQEDMPESLVLNVTKNNARGAIVILAQDLDNLFWVYWDATHVVFIQRVDSSDSLLCALPKVFAGVSDLEVSVQRGEEGYFVSIWFDEQFGANVYIPTLLENYKVGFGVYGSDVITFDDFRIPELTEVIAILTMDVGEYPLGALQRAIGRRHINYFVRFNGALRAWRPKAVASAKTFEDRAVYLSHLQLDRRSLVSHWRQIGAWDVADAFDDDLLQQIGHRFHKDDNPDLMTASECQTEADRSLVRLQEYAHTVDIEFPFWVFMEPEDHFTVRGADWFVTNYGIDLRAGALTGKGTLRAYLY